MKNLDINHLVLNIVRFWIPNVSLLNSIPRRDRANGEKESDIRSAGFLRGSIPFLAFPFHFYPFLFIKHILNKFDFLDDNFQY